MPSRLLLVTGWLCTFLPLTSAAQTSPGSSRFYVGVGTNLLSNVPFKQQGTVPRSLGPALTVGRQFTPRLALQTGLSYHRKQEQQDLLISPGVVATVSRRYFLVPALLRYTTPLPHPLAWFTSMCWAAPRWLMSLAAPRMLVPLPCIPNPVFPTPGPS